MSERFWSKATNKGKNLVMEPRKVLVIEDDDAVRLALDVFLSADDSVAEVATAPDGTQGVEAARRIGPDVIVTDSSMPGLAGDELGQALRATCPAATIISFSGSTQTASWADHRIQKGDGASFDALAEAVAGHAARSDQPVPIFVSEPDNRKIHDLRNALTPVAGYASLLEGNAETLTAEQLKMIAAKIMKSVDRATGMIDTL